MSKENKTLFPLRQGRGVLLGQLIRKARIDKKMTAAEVADRAGLSRGLLRRIENGDPGCTLGSVFEAASVVGVRLFDADETTLSGALASNTAVMTLLPKAIRAPRAKPDDNF